MSKNAYVKAYPNEFREKVVKLMQVGDRSPREVTEEFGISEDSVRRWVQQAEFLERANRFERDADGIARTPELLAEFEYFTEQDAEEWGAMEDPAAEAAFESLVQAAARKASSA